MKWYQKLTHEASKIVMTVHRSGAIFIKPLTRLGNCHCLAMAISKPTSLVRFYEYGSCSTGNWVQRITLVLRSPLGFLETISNTLLSLPLQRQVEPPSPPATDQLPSTPEGTTPHTLFHFQGKIKLLCFRLK